MNAYLKTSEHASGTRVAQDNGATDSNAACAQNANLQVDGDVSHDIAICGFSVKFPQEATSPNAFWNMMMERRCAMTDFPEDRICLEGFHSSRNKLNTLPLKGGHFLKDDLSVFDADFFSISPAEAAAMDPMQRWLLEATYRAFENAGMPMETVSGTATGVYTGSFSLDYMLQLARDPESTPMYASVGFGLSMLANRLSWLFNLRGPSVGLDSACSSTAVAIDIACQALRNGSCSTAIVAGSNLASAPEGYVWMSNANFLSPDSRCYSFDERGNGYARGEGLAVLVLKKVTDAVRDGNTIRAVIRSTGSNEDGKTPGITQPSREAQEQLIRDTYAKANLSMAPTRFFEAHGTGTPIGDPREARAIGSAFRRHRTEHDPLYVGAVKSNIGHLEGASGLAGVIKAVLTLERGVIPPNTNFKRVNPKIDTRFLRIRFPEESCPWPGSGLRRASVNSFGYGGANSHIVLDDAYHYLKLRSMSGMHCTIPSAPDPSLSQPLLRQDSVEPKVLHHTRHMPRLLVISSADKQGIGRIAQSYKEWPRGESSTSAMLSNPGEFMANLSFTLAQHRSHLAWRSFAILRSPDELRILQSQLSPPNKVLSPAPRLGYVFTGQGAQWYAMGRELLGYTSFKADMDRAQIFYDSLGCNWSIIDELCKDEEESLLERPELSQPICTVLQVALVNLTRTFGIQPSAVVGHSSGEIAAAYAAGYLTCESAWKLAYFRGICAKEIATICPNGPRGAMMSVGLSESRVKEIMSTINHSAGTFGITVACINSPNNVTVSGEESRIDQLKSQLDDLKVFSRKLRVTVAYHSPQMELISAKYEAMIGSLRAPTEQEGLARVPMLSSVTGELLDATRIIDPNYWVQNTVSPVQFTRALLHMCAKDHAGLVKKLDRSHISASVVDHLVEIGPHATLAGPIRETLSLSPRVAPIGYTCLLRRGVAATETMFRAMGELYSIGFPLDLGKVTWPVEDNTRPNLLVDLPEYPFDHSQKYWHESRLSSNYRFRRSAPSELLGVPTNDWMPDEPRWRHFIRLSEMPWAEHHAINGVVLYPATGMLAMAVEAARQLVSFGSEVHIEGYTLRDVQFEGPMSIPAESVGLEAQTSLRPLDQAGSECHSFEFTIRTHNHGEWLVNCRGRLAVDVSTVKDDWEKEKSFTQRSATAQQLKSLLETCEVPVESGKMYNYLRESGYDYGPAFQAAEGQRYSEEPKAATAEVALCDVLNESHVFHPASLDAMLHICFTAFSAGGTLAMATNIPSRIGHIWISNEGLQWRDGRRSVNAIVSITKRTNRGFLCNGGALDKSDHQKLRLWYEDVELTSVSDVPKPPLFPNPKQWCMNIECKVALDKLSSEEVFSLLQDLHTAQEVDAQISKDLEMLIELSLGRLASHLGNAPPQGEDHWKTRYWRWAEYQLAHRPERKELPDGPITPAMPSKHRSFQDLVDRLEATNSIGRLYSRVASNLKAFFTGDADPMDCLIHSGLLEDYDRELASHRHSRQMASYLDLMAHQRPGMTILEVGGGTGAATRNFVNVLRSGSPTNPGSLRCKRYDLSRTIFSTIEKARDEFAPFQAQMTFSTLDVEQDTAGQGFEAASYDVVIADNVLHATSNLARSLQNIRQTMKPGAKFLIHESLKPCGWTLGFVFGLFPAWWAGAGENRLLSPSISSDAWDALLKANGFSGTDMVFRDCDVAAAHSLGWIVTTAVGEGPDTLLNHLKPLQLTECRFTIVIDNTAVEQRELSAQLVPLIKHHLGIEPCVGDMESVCSGPADPKEIIIFLVDYQSTLLKSLDQHTWPLFSTFIKRARGLLWVSGCNSSDLSPDQGLLDGLSRCLRTEYYELHLVTLAMDISPENPDGLSLLVKVAVEMAHREPGRPYEQEYLEINGLLHTRRLVEATDLKADMDAALSNFKTVKTPLDGSSRLCLSTDTSGARPYPVFMPELPRESAKLGENDVEILARVVYLPPHQSAKVLGADDKEDARYYCAGTILAVGNRGDDLFRPGDNVLAACSGVIRSRLRVPAQLVVKLPGGLSLADACAEIPILATAHALLANIGHVQQSDAVLIHQGITPIGQAAIRLLLDQGVANIWVTADGKDDFERIRDSFGVGPDRILPESWFGTESMMLSQWKSMFDLVLLQTAGSLASHAMDYVKFGGRVILLGTGTSPSSQDFQGLPIGISVTSLHMSQIHKTVRHESLKQVVDRNLRLPWNRNNQPLKLFAASNIQDAWNHSLKHDSDHLIVELGERDMVDVRVMLPPRSTFSSAATYVVVGGLGGLGRAIVRWMIARGARYLILLSRSGAKAAAAQQLLHEASLTGIRVETPLCDVGDKSALRAALSQCGHKMPPIKGCIQASMVMREHIFQKMEFQDWNDPINSKLHGSWNLHCELPDNLDFFIMISSMMSTMGGASLSSYSAANSYMDALARHRVSRGQRAAALGLGPVPDSGWLTEHQDRLAGVDGEKYVPTFVKEIYALMEIFCDRDCPFKSPTGCQPVLGIRPPAHWCDVEEVPFTMSQPFWGHMHHVPKLYLGSQGDNSGGTVNRRRALNTAKRVARSESLAEAAEIASQALAQRTLSLLGTAADRLAEDRLDFHKPMHSFGIDSLSAVDIRNWVGQTFDVDLPVFEILGGATFTSAGLFIASKLQFKA